MTSEPTLRQSLRSQIIRVDARVRGIDQYAADSKEIRRAVEQVPDLRKRLGLGAFRRSLTPLTGKPQLLLVFDSDAHSRAMLLKVYGKRRPGEGAVQRYWSQFDIRCAVTLEHGDDPMSWLLMQVIDGHDLAHEVAGSTETGKVFSITRELAEVISLAHDLPVAPLEGSRALAEGIMRHLQAVVDALIRHGYRPPRDWLRTAADVYDCGRSCLLHGDLCFGNVMRDRTDGGLRVIDSCAYIGDPAFDAARWAVRVATPNEYSAVITAWLNEEPGLDDVALTGMLGAESLMQAGVREIVKDEKGLPWRERDEVTEAYLDAASDLFGSWLSGRAWTPG